MLFAGVWTAALRPLRVFADTFLPAATSETACRLCERLLETSKEFPDQAGSAVMKLIPLCSIIPITHPLLSDRHLVTSSASLWLYSVFHRLRAMQGVAGTFRVRAVTARPPKAVHSGRIHNSSVRSFALPRSHGRTYTLKGQAKRRMDDRPFIKNRRLPHGVFPDCGYTILQCPLYHCQAEFLRPYKVIDTYQYSIINCLYQLHIAHLFLRRAA